MQLLPRVLSSHVLHLLPDQVTTERVSTSYLSWPNNPLSLVSPTREWKLHLQTGQNQKSRHQACFFLPHHPRPTLGQIMCRPYALRSFLDSLSSPLPRQPSHQVLGTLPAPRGPDSRVTSLQSFLPVAGRCLFTVEPKPHTSVLLLKALPWLCLPQGRGARE